MVFNEKLDKKAIEALGEIPYDYKYAHIFEKAFLGYEDAFVEWCQRNTQFVFILAVFYFLSIFTIKRIMKNREKFELRLPLILWSGFLTIFSTMGAIRTSQILIHVVFNHSFYHSMCSPYFYFGISGFWSILFTLSKPFELIDTYFIVLRKQPLIFLHWYHHITVMLYVFVTYSEHLSMGCWFMTMNYIVHAIMYCYYTLRAMKITPPRYMAMSITSLQLLQMVVGFLINVCALVIRFNTNLFCQFSDIHLAYGLAMYLSYFVLFFLFFRNAYIKPKTVKTA